MKPPIKDTLKEDKPPNKGHTKCTLVLQSNLRKRTTSLQRTNGWVPMVSTIQRFHCSSNSLLAVHGIGRYSSVSDQLCSLFVAELKLPLPVNGTRPPSYAGEMSRKCMIHQKCAPLRGMSRKPPGPCYATLREMSRKPSFLCYPQGNVQKAP